MVQLGDFEVTVSSPGVGRLTEFQDPDAAHVLEKVHGPGVVRYLLATSGANFSIGYGILAGHKFLDDSLIRFYIKTDGNRVKVPIIRQAEHSSVDGFHKECEGRRSGKGKNANISKLKFGDIKQSDADTGETSEELRTKHASVGTITVVVERRKQLRKSTLGDNHAQLDCLTEEFPEAAFKGNHVDMLTKYGPAEQCPESTAWVTEAIDPEPRATFIFKYRSRDVLEKLGVLDKDKSLHSNGTAQTVVPKTPAMGRMNPTSRAPLTDEFPAKSLASSPSRASVSSSTTMTRSSIESSTHKRKSSTTSAYFQADPREVDDQGYIRDTVKMMRSDITAMVDEDDWGERRSRGERLRRKLNVLEGEILEVPAPFDNIPGTAAAPFQQPRQRQKAIPQPGQTILCISDDDRK